MALAKEELATASTLIDLAEENYQFSLKAGDTSSTLFFQQLQTIQSQYRNIQRRISYLESMSQQLRSCNNNVNELLSLALYSLQSID